ncbi:MAG: hypothetical protein Q8Q07_04730 [Dehalococcoidales bacterium]|nr:hypothetical protein [Dehalococcoidales bacterium]
MQKSNNKSKVFTPNNPQCRLCHYAGYSNKCDLVYSGQCTVVMSWKDIGKTKED